MKGNSKKQLWSREILDLKCYAGKTSGKKNAKFNWSNCSIQELTIELGVFVDDALWFYFNELYGQKAEKELQRYVLAIVNNVSYRW